MDERAYRRIEKDYQKAVHEVYNQIWKAIGKNGTPEEWLSRLSQIASRKEYQELADKLAYTMTKNVEVQNAKTWRTAAKKASRSTSLFKELLSNESTSPAFNSNVRFNAYYIKTAPQEIAQWITKETARMSIEGKGIGDIAKEIRAKYPKYSKYHSELLARTETSKTQSALIQSKALQVGASWYLWKDVGDARTRRSHKHMHNVLVSWNEPPSPESLVGEKDVGNYHAGNIYNCRCYPEPIVTIEQIPFPVEVYSNGKLTRMTKAQFIERYGTIGI